MKVNSLLLHFSILSWSKIKASVEIPNFLNTSHSYFCSFSKFHLSGQNQTSPPLLMWALVIFLPVTLVSRPYFPQKQDFVGVGSEAGSLLTCWDAWSSRTSHWSLLAQAGMGMWGGCPSLAAWRSASHEPGFGT